MYGLKDGWVEISLGRPLYFIKMIKVLLHFGQGNQGAVEGWPDLRSPGWPGWFLPWLGRALSLTGWEKGGIGSAMAGIVDPILLWLGLEGAGIAVGPGVGVPGEWHREEPSGT
jgi:hypothetical protein